MTREQIETLVEREGERITLEGSTIVSEQPRIREPGFTDMSNQRREDMLKLVIRRFVGAA